MTFKFDFHLLSKYRTELMGFATLLIIICHTPRNEMPNWLGIIIGNLGLGVDIFLFLSGMGLYNSYKNRKVSIPKWFIKRYERIIVPLLLIVIPILIFNKFLNSEGEFRSVLSYLGELSGFGYLFYGRALWFVSCILFLYIITPLLYKILDSKHKYSIAAILSLLCFIIAYILPEKDPWAFMIQRWPSYILGFAMAVDIKEHKQGSIWHFIVLPLFTYSFLFALNHTIGTHFSLFAFQGIPIMTISAILIDEMKSERINKVLVFMGLISLESYITNIYLISLLKSLPLHLHIGNVLYILSALLFVL